MGAHLQVEAMGTVPVAVDNVHFAVTVEVGQGDAAPVLVGVVHPWRGKGESPEGRLHAHSPGGLGGEQWGRAILTPLISPPG